MDKIVCRELEVANTAGNLVAGIGADEYGGVMQVHNTAGENVILIGTTEDGDGKIQTYKGGWRTH